MSELSALSAAIDPHQTPVIPAWENSELWEEKLTNGDKWPQAIPINHPSALEEWKVFPAMI